MTTYSTISGQTWDMISKEIYGTELKVGVLMEANPKLLDIFIFPANVKLNVPEVDEENTDLPPWRW